MFLQGEKVLLRPPEREQIDLFLRWLNNPEVIQFLARHRPLNRAEEEEWFANLHKREGDYVFLIVAREGGIPIGSCGLHRVEAPHRSAELGILIGEKEYWGRGFGGEAIRLLCEYGFEVLNLHRIGLSVYEYNERGIRCYEKAGFVREGCRREARFWKGRYGNIYQYGLLAREWRDRNRQTARALPELSAS